MKLTPRYLSFLVATLLTVAASGMARAEDAPSISSMLAKADVAAGEKTAHTCAMCHSFDKGGANKMGPNLWGIVGSNHAHASGFSYSTSMAALRDKKWTYDALNQFLFSPQAAAPGTKMPFAGVKDTAARANVIAYLRTLSDQPTPLP